MNYAEISDFEINKAVASGLGYKIGNDFQSLLDELAPGCVNVITEGSQSTFDPCNSWADAGPIIQGNYLSIECDDMFDLPMPSSCWKAYNPKGNHYTDENPLRAAMIVFLMMQEGE